MRTLLIRTPASGSRTLFYHICALTFGYQDNFKGTGQGSLVRMALGSVGLIWAWRLRLLFPALFVLFSGWMLANTFVPLGVTRLYNGADVGTATGLVIAAAGRLQLEKFSN